MNVLIVLTKKHDNCPKVIGKITIIRIHSKKEQKSIERFRENYKSVKPCVTSLLKKLRRCCQIYKIRFKSIVNLSTITPSTEGKYQF